MVLTKKDLDAGLEGLKAEFQAIIQTNISELREAIIDNLVEANKALQLKVVQLEEVVERLTIEFQANLQYQRQNNIIISGIPPEVEHENLEKVAVEVVNTCSQTQVNTGDVQGCHRLSRISTDVICRFTSKKPVEEALGNWHKLKNLDKRRAGLPDSTGELYINTHLTPYNSKLAYHCRQLKKTNLIKKRKGL